jgi:hypothetical protein
MSDKMTKRSDGYEFIGGAWRSPAAILRRREKARLREEKRSLSPKYRKAVAKRKKEEYHDDPEKQRKRKRVEYWRNAMFSRTSLQMKVPSK